MLMVSVEGRFSYALGDLTLAERDVLGSLPQQYAVQADGRIRFASSKANFEHLEQQAPSTIYHDPTFYRQSLTLPGAVRHPPGEYEANWPFKLEPWPFQLEVFASARLMDVFGIAPADMGTGKTKMSLDIAADKFMRGEIDCLLVVAPNGVHRQWVNEALPKHMTEAVQWRAHVFRSGRVIPDTMDKPKPGSRRILRIMTMNTEAFSAEKGRAFKAARAFLRSARGMLVIDESSRIKNYDRARTRAIIRLRDEAPVRCILTGTPITKGLEDMYPQMMFLDPNIVGLSTITAFRGRYCIRVSEGRLAAFGVARTIGWRNVEDFVRRVSPYLFRVSKDALGLPEKMTVKRPVELTAEQRHWYDKVSTGLITDIETGRVTRLSLGAKLVRLQQILSGYYIEVLPPNPEVDDSNTKRYEVTPLPTERLEAVLAVLAERDGQAIVWCRFQKDIDMVAEALRKALIPCATYDGRTSLADRDAAKKAIIDGTVRVLVANPAAAGTGTDGLQVCRTGIYFSNSFDAELRWQSEDRLHRPGMGDSVLYVDLRCAGTIDVLIERSLIMKQGIADMVLASPLMLRLGGVDGTDD